LQRSINTAARVSVQGHSGPVVQQTALSQDYEGDLPKRAFTLALENERPQL